MPPFYVTHQNARLHIRNRRLEVEDPDGPRLLASMPLSQVTQVIVFGNVSLTTPAIDALLSQGCEIIFLTHNGEYRGQATGRITPHCELRRMQYRRLDEPDFRRATACGLLGAKLAHQKALLLRHSPSPRDDEAQAYIGRVEAALASVTRKQTTASLRGLEGAATRAYFHGYRRFFDPQWRFSMRDRRPPGDPINSLLSFGYTLLAHAADGATRAAGLDPFAGFLHETAYNRPALALDLMEEFRPVIDGLVLWICRSGQLKPEDFTPGVTPFSLQMNETARGSFILAYERRMDLPYTHPLRKVKLPIRQCLVEQARQLAARILSNQGGFTGMGFR